MDIPKLIALETKVWEALQSGDVAADAALLSEDFVGLYPTGFADRGDHAGQLDEGPTVAEFSIHEARAIQLSPEHAVLAYRADYRRPGNSDTESMYVSSVWSQHDGRWVNVFSQDTPVDPERPVP